MATLQDIISSDTTLTRSQVKSDKKLVMEIQSKLANLGFYPGGGWIDGDIGNDGEDTFTWKGLGTFSQASGLTGLPTAAIAINQAIAQKLLSTKQIDSVLKTATQSSILARLQAIQAKSPIVNGNTPSSAFVGRTLAKSPFQSFVADYPTFLAQKPDGATITSYGDSFTLSTGTVVNFSDYPPDLGAKPAIDNNGLDFLSSNISHACLCIGSFSDGGSQIKAHWVGKNALNSTNLWWSTSKFIGVLNAVCQINKNSINTDVDDCVIIKSPSTRYRFHDLVKDMVSYQGLSSNAIGVLFKSFTKREDLSNWIKQLTGNSTLDFRGSYGEPPLVSPAKVTDTTTGIAILSSTILSSTALGAATSTNSLAAYDLVRLISMLGWHLHLPATAQLPGAQWKSLESVVRAMGNDTARYVDVALETLGVVNVISEPVIISKVGWGNIEVTSGPITSGSMTYTAFVKFIDRRFTPGKLRTFAFTLRCTTPLSAGNFDGRDTNLAVAVTEIIRRILTEELA